MYNINIGKQYSIYIEENFDNIKKYLIKDRKNEWDNLSFFFEWCARHGMNSVGDKPTTGIYRQV